MARIKNGLYTHPTNWRRNMPGWHDLEPKVRSEFPFIKSAYSVLLKRNAIRAVGQIKGIADFKLNTLVKRAETKLALIDNFGTLAGCSAGFIAALCYVISGGKKEECWFKDDVKSRYIWES